jgi:hypothetical protein
MSAVAKIAFRIERDCGAACFIALPLRSAALRAAGVLDGNGTVSLVTGALKNLEPHQDAAMH